MLGSCSDPIEVSEPIAVPYSPGTVTISFKNSNMTRSDDSDNSETKIENLIVGLYVDSPDETVPPVAFQTFESLTNVYKNHQVVMQLTDDMIDALFTTPAKTQCRLFAVANVPEGTTVPVNATINQLKQLPVTADFRNTSLQSSFVMTGAGDVTYTPPEAGEKVGSASGAATLYRAAAKIRLNLQIPDTIHVGNATDFEIWAPIKENARALLNNGVQMAVAAPKGSADIPWKPENQNAYYNSALKTGSERAFKNEGTGTYSYIMDVPFYTYPNAWEESTLEDNKTTLTLILPWGKQGEQSWNTYYYQIPITPVNLPHLDRNYSYTVNLKVGMLGSLTPEVPVTPEEDLSYQIVNWGNKEVDVDIKDFRYLVVNPNVVTVNNEAEMLIPFYSSHPVDISNISMSFKRFNFYTGTNGEVVDITVPQSKLDASINTADGTKMVDYSIYTDQNTGQKYLRIKHALEVWTPVNNTSPNITNNNTVQLTGNDAGSLTDVESSINHFNRPDNPEASYSPYTFNVHIQHGDKTAYSEDIVITQYPGMYITADRNSGGSYNTNNNNYNYTSNYGFVFVNPTLVNGSRRDYWTNDTELGGVHGLGTSGNQNPNMYVITISQLSEGSQFIIGDPRTKVINNNLSGNNALTEGTQDQTTVGSWSNQAVALYNTTTGKRQLRYYYPTREVAATDKNAYMVAPKIRVASSYGKCTNGRSREQARRRCASYQERGYPAGRWRLPTLGEFTYITQLSGKGIIPLLFNNNQSYLTAQGFYQVDAKGVVTPASSNDASVRAVYDEWYWENSDYNLNPDATSYDFTYGDMPRDKQ